jgi:tellurite resistance protein TerC
MIWLWTGFIGLIILLLALDLGLFHRKAHVIRMREAFFWTAFWIALSLLFNGLIYFIYEHHWFEIGSIAGHEVNGKEAALKFFTGYILEKSLSLDNIFVIAMIFSYFKVSGQYQHQVLFWGILGAIVLRAIMIIIGVVLIQKFTWMIFVFGIFLIFTAIKIHFTQDKNLDPENNLLVRWAKKIFPMTHHYHQARFFIKEGGRWVATPLLLVLIVVESSDVLFAVDSIPAIFAVTTDPFIIFTSNIFAILGLRSLYFALASVIEKFRYLKISLVYILVYVGVKMILSDSYPIPTYISLGVIILILFIGIAASVYAEKRDATRLKSAVDKHEG